MQNSKYSCTVDDCDTVHSSWQHVETCVHCDAVVCRDNCYRELPVEELFMKRSRRCPECEKPMRE